MLRFLLALLLLVIGPPALAQPTCTSNAPACFPQAVNPLQTDIVLGQQATGPSRSNQVVKFSLSQLSGIGSSTTGQLLINLGNTVNGATIGSGLSLAGGILSATGSAGVTSVGLTMPGGFTVQSSPVTTSGTLTVTLNTTSGALVYNSSGALQPVTIGSGLSFTGGVLSWTGAGGSGSGTVTTTGNPVSGLPAFFSGATSITGTNLAGDVTTSGSNTTTLATVNSNVGTFANPNVTVNGKGLVTAISAGNPVPTAANPTGTAGPSAVNGSATTYMRSDAAPAVQLGTTSAAGIVQPDGQTVAVASGKISLTVPDRSVTTNTAIVAGDMGGQVNLNGSSLTLTIPAISSTVFAVGMSTMVCNQNATTVTISSTPTINGYTAGTIPAASSGTAACISFTSNGTSLDAVPVISSTGMSLTAAGQVFSGGVHPTAFSNGTASSGTKTIDCGNNPIQTLTNGGAFTLAMSANDGSCVLRVTNNASAGTITFSGFSEGSNAGDALTTTNGNIFDIALTRIGGNPHYLVSALQ